MTEVTLPRGETLFREGDSGDCLYVITDGKIKLGRAAADGRENILAILGPGEMFGELSLFDPKPRTATAVAVVDSTLMSLGHHALDQLLTGRPAVAEAMLAAAQRLRRTNESSPTGLQRCAGRVARRYRPVDALGGSHDGLHVTHDLTQEELAQLVGASRETVNKALADFASRGWIRLEARAVVIHDVDRLSRRAR